MPGSYWHPVSCIASCELYMPVICMTSSELYSIAHLRAVLHPVSCRSVASCELQPVSLVASSERLAQSERSYSERALSELGFQWEISSSERASREQASRNPASGGKISSCKQASGGQAGRQASSGWASLNRSYPPGASDPEAGFERAFSEGRRREVAIAGCG